VTGAAGLVGQHLLPRLARHWNVFALSRGAAPAGRPNITWFERDLANADFTSGLPERIDAVVHLAQSRRFREVPEGNADVLAVNVAATEQLARYATRAGASHFVLASTGSVYAPTNTTITESSPLGTPEALGWYAASKLAAESVAMAYKSRLVPVVLRPFFVYGAGQHRGMLVPRLADAIERGESVTLTGEDGMWLAPTHASDAASAFVAALSLEGAATVNVCGPEILSLRAVCETLGAVIGRAPSYDVVAPGTADFRVNGARMRELLGATRCTFDEGAATAVNA